MEQQPHTPQRNRLEGILSRDFDACNIIAAEASNLAHEKLKKADRQTLYIFNDETAGNTSTSVDAVDIGGINNTQIPYTDEGSVDLYVTRPSGPSKSEDPQLLAKIRDDLAVPIATFAARSGSHCSYVQLGREITDDSFVVTPRDNRKNIVAAIRAFLRGETSIDCKALAQLAQTETTNQAASIEQQMAPALVRLVQKQYAAGSPTTRPFYILTPEGPLHQKLRTVKFRPGVWALQDGRKVELLLAGQPSGRFRRRLQPDNLQLLAVTRQNVAVPVLGFSDAGVTNTLMGQPQDKSGIEAVRNALLQPLSDAYYEFEKAEQAYSPARFAEVTLEGSEKWMKSYFQNEQLAIAKAAMDFADPGHAHLLANIQPGQYSSEIYEKVTKILSGKLENEHDSYIDSSIDLLTYVKQEAGIDSQNAWKLNLEINALCKRMICQHNLEIASRSDSAGQLIRSLEVHETFEEQLGPYHPATEVLLTVLGCLANRGSAFNARIESKINEDETDRGDVDILAHITAPAPGTYGVTIQCRPTHLANFGTSTVFDETISKSEKMPLAPDDIAEMQQLLGKISLR